MAKRGEKSDEVEKWKEETEWDQIIKEIIQNILPWGVLVKMAE